MTSLLKSKIYFLIPLVFSFIAVFFLSNSGIFYSIIVFGQAHFLIAYYYRNRNVGMDSGYIKNFLVLSVILGVVSFYILQHLCWFNLLILVTLEVFAIHYFNDEFKLHNISSIKNQLFGTIAVGFSFLAVFLTKLYFVGLGYIYILFVFAIIFAVFFTKNLLFDKNITSNKIDIYFFYLFFLLNIFIPFLIVFQKNILNYQVAGFIILFHYIRWYLYYFERFKGDNLKHYMNVIILFNFSIIILFIMYTKISYFHFLYVFFNPIFFYGWTLMHILLSIRGSDYRIELK